MNRDIIFLKNTIIAHRGLHNDKYPENSLSAYKNAIKNNFIIEIDLHLLKDGNVVVFHDDNLKRMTGVDKAIKDCTYDEIKDLKLKNSEESIPLFSEVLDLVNGKVPLLIEYKYDVKVGLLEEASMKYLCDYKGKFAIQSFDSGCLKWFKKNYPDIIRGFLSCNYSKWKKKFFVRIYMNHFLKSNLESFDFISYDIKSLPSNVIEENRDKIYLLGWTVRNRDDYDLAKKYCDNFIVENIGVTWNE